MANLAKDRIDGGAQAVGCEAHPTLRLADRPCHVAAGRQGVIASVRGGGGIRHAAPAGGGELFSQKLRATLEKGRDVLTAVAQAEREQLRQAGELRKAEELKHTLRPRHGLSMGR